MPVRFNLESDAGSGASKQVEDTKGSKGRTSSSKRSDEEDEEAVRKFLEDTLASLEDSEREAEEGEQENESSALPKDDGEEDEEEGLDLAFFDKDSEAERLLVHRCHVSERTAERLGEALAENRHVKTLCMQDCEVASAACVRQLLRGVTASAWGGLHTLSLEACALNDTHAQCLVECLRFCKKGGLSGPFALHTLALPHNHLTAQACVHLALLLRPPLTTWLKLRVLDVRGNRVGDEGAAILGMALTHNNHLGTMDSGSAMAGQGAQGGHKQSHSHREGLLREIDLSFNRIGARGLCVLCESLVHPCVGLRVLGLRGNVGGAAGASALARALATTNTSLVTIDFRENNIELIRAVQALRLSTQEEAKGKAKGKPSALRLLQLGGNNLHVCSCQSCSHERIEVAGVNRQRGAGPLITLDD